MDSGNLGGLESILEDIKDLEVGSELDSIMDKVNFILDYTTDKLEQERLDSTLYTNRDMFMGLPNSYYVEMDLPTQLDFLNVYPVRSDSGLIYLKVSNIPDFPFEFVSSDGYIRCDSVNIKLQGVLASIPSGWNLQIIHRMHGRTQTIVATSEMLTVYMNIIPAFEFNASQWPLDGPPVAAGVTSKFPWFAVPWQNPVNKDNNAFMAYVPFWLTEILKDLPNSLVFLNFMTGWHAKRARDLPNFSAYMLKSFMLQYVLNNGQSDVGLDQLVHIMPKLLAQLNSGRLDSFLVAGQNMLECMTVGEIHQCMATFHDLYTEAPYDSQEFWADLLESSPDVVSSFSQYITINIIAIK